MRKNGTAAKALGAVLAPGRWPLVGHAPALLANRLRFLSTLPALGDVVEIRLGPIPAYVVTNCIIKISFAHGRHT